jgi:hypothetical protein
VLSVFLEQEREEERRRRRRRGRKETEAKERKKKGRGGEVERNAQGNGAFLLERKKRIRNHHTVFLGAHGSWTKKRGMQKEVTVFC